MRDMFISVVIPAYNEAAIIESTIRQTLSYLAGEFSEYELIISDDGSTDNTKELALAVEDPRLRVTGHFPNKGKGAAVRDGVLAAGGDIVLYTDADLAYGLEVIGHMADKLRETGAQAVIGSRRLHPDGYAEYPPIRLLASRCFSFLTGTIAGFRYDTQCGIKAFSAAAAEEVFSLCDCDGFAFDFEVMMLCNAFKMRVEQYPVSIINFRDSKVNVLRDSLKMLADVFRIRKDVKSRMKAVKSRVR